MYLPHSIYHPPLSGTGPPVVEPRESQTSTQSVTVTCKTNVQFLKAWQKSLSEIMVHLHAACRT